ncbi:MaoC family dehydratase N-terminal domain-containing protein [Gordonia sp. NPDC127522]|uniref:FAS1-like dehydratase domain-containing protein n=1 Tax=Gordonia sp. NPDC127522 TaxID=3345390 RepID=UPI003635618A
MSVTASTLIEKVFASASAVVGEVSRIELGTVRELDLQRFDVAVSGSLDGLTTGLSRQLYLSSVLAWSDGPAESDLLPDGNAADPFSGFDVAGLRLMAGGQDLTFHRDLTPGSSVTLDVKLADAQLKDTKSGRLLVLRVERVYSDSDGLLTECRETFLGREALA